MENKKEIITSGFYYIKPAANHILTVGKGIIKDSYTAILELVKNSYDADAEAVKIKFLLSDNSTKIIVEDDGHGMSFKTVTEKWMVPSTADKLRQKRSLYKKRPLQGRKGIGRYAASILGDDLLLKTTEKETLVTTELLIDWKDFSTDEKFLEDVDILIESYKIINSKPGTYLSITGGKTWTDKELDELNSSLKRLLSPFDDIDQDFKIFLEIEKENSDKYQLFAEQVRPLPVLEYYHYRVSGNIKQKDLGGEKKLIADLDLQNKYLKGILPIKVYKEILLSDGEEYCGDLTIDIRAFDLDEDPPIDQNKISIEEAKKQLRELPGIAVIREGFRVRPYGERKIDWLSLNERRYNNPTLRLSSNQVAGYVNVQQEGESHLIEKATREGFKEDEFYEGLKECIIQCLVELETLRYKYRKSHNKGGRKQKTIIEKIQDASDFSKLNKKITSLLSSASATSKITGQVQEIINEEAKEKAIQLEEIKKIIAQYEGQVTLGKIMTVVLHEGRKPLNALRQHPKFITEWTKEFISLVNSQQLFKNDSLKSLSDKIVDRLYDNRQQAEIFVNIFKKLEPLANSKRLPIREFKIIKPIEDAFKLFEAELTADEIGFTINGDIDTTFIGWDVDFYIAFANLIENSIYWTSNSKLKKITVDISAFNDKIIIDYADTGTGIDDENIETQDIFDPGFSTKPDGTGLGLSIAGEAFERNKGSIKAIANNDGANFLIELKK